MDERSAILMSLQPLFDKAEREGLWFFSTYQQIWFSPAALKRAHEDGRFIWGPANWALRDPKEKIEQLRAEAAKATNEADSMVRELYVSSVAK